jgi:hypothetical protein
LAKFAFSLVALCLLISPAIRPATGAEILNFPKPKATPALVSPPAPAPVVPAPIVPAPVPAPAPQLLRPAGIANDCKEWTDSCRVCALDDKGVVACSNIGIACQPEKWRCTRP